MAIAGTGPNHGDLFADESGRATKKAWRKFEGPKNAAGGRTARNRPIADGFVRRGKAQGWRGNVASTFVLPRVHRARKFCRGSASMMPGNHLRFSLGDNGKSPPPGPLGGTISCVINLAY